MHLTYGVEIYYLVMASLCYLSFLSFIWGNVLLNTLRSLFWIIARTIYRHAIFR